METANISSVFPKATKSRCQRGISAASRWESESDIKRYRRLMIKSVTAISKKAAPAAIRSMPANCPVPVKFVKEISIGDHRGSPFCTASIPKAKDTERYPIAIGSPSLIPF